MKIQTYIQFSEFLLFATKFDEVVTNEDEGDKKTRIEKEN